MSRANGPVVVIGMGNVLLRDDGVGVRVVEALSRLAEGDAGVLPAGTQLVDGGTLGLDLLEQVDEAGALILVDAVNLGQPPGTVCVTRGSSLSADNRPDGASRPGGPAELLALAGMMGTVPLAVALVGVQAGEIGVGLALSPAVAAALPAAVATVRIEAFGQSRKAATSGRTSELAGATA